MGNNTALGTGDLLFNATLPVKAQLSSSTAVTLGNRLVVLVNKTGTITGTNNLTLNGPVILNGTIVDNDTATVVLGGSVTGSGAINANAGVLAVNANYGSVTASIGGGTLTGTGTVNSITQTSGTLEPGAGGSGTLTANGPVTLTGGSFQVDVNAATAGTLMAPNITVTGATLTVNVVSAGTTGQVYSLASAGTTLTGPFSGLPAGTTVVSGGRTYQIAYTSTAARLTDVSPAVPVITSVSPGSGPITGGTVVTITGSSFTGTTAVSFGGTPAASFTVNSATSITATAPPGIGSVDITMTNAAGTSSPVAGDKFAYVSPVGVSSLVTGPAGGAGNVQVIVIGAWTATANASWLHTASSGTGPGLATFTADPNTGPARTGTLTIAGATVTVTQAPAGAVQATQFGTLVGTGLSLPSGLAVDAAGNVFIADSGNRAVKKLAPGSTTPTLLPFTGLGNPTGVAVDAAGDVFVTDGSANTVYELTPAGVQTTLGFSGLGFADGVAVDAAGDVFVVDQSNNAVKELTPAGVQTTLPFSGLGTPTGIAVDGAGNVFVADFDNNTVRELVAGAATSVSLPLSGLFGAQDVKVDGAGNLFVADFGNNAVKELPLAYVPGSVSVPAAAGTGSVAVTAVGNAPLSGPFAPTSDQPWLTITGTANGQVTYSVTANSGPAARTAHLTVLGVTTTVTQQQPAPTVTGISPAIGPTAGGTTVTITGTNLAGATAVAFGGTAATGFTIVSATSITATAPAGLAGAVDLTVTTPGGTSVTSTADLFTYGTAPAITSPSATTFTVGAAGTFAATASGSPVPTFSLTGALPAGVTFTSATGVFAGTPAAGSAGTYPVTVTATNALGSASQTFALTVATGSVAPVFSNAPAVTFTVGTAGSFTFTASGTPAPTFSVTAGTLPAGLTLSPGGVLSGTPAPGTFGTFPITVTAANGSGPGVAQSFSLTVAPPTTKVNWFVAGTGPGVTNEVKVWKADGTLISDFQPFAPGFTGGVSVALGDVNGDGLPDIIVGAATAGAAHVKVIDGSLFGSLVNNVSVDAVPSAVLASFYAYSTAFTGGVTVAAGRLDGTGNYNVITGAGLGGGPEVKVWAIANGGASLIRSPVADFFALDPNFRGGVTVAAGDVEGLHNGTDDLVVGAASNGAPQVKLYRPTGQEIANFYAAFAGNHGVTVAVGDVEGKGFAQLILGEGGGPGSVPQVLVDQYVPAAPNSPGQLDSFFAYATDITSGTTGTFAGGVNVAASSATSLASGAADLLVTGAGPGGGPQLRALNRLAGTELFGPGGLFAFPTGPGGVNV